MHVILVGAGACIPAGYPGGQDLLSSVERHFNDAVVEMNAKSYWSWFLEARARARSVASPELRLLWESVNPEVVASYLDLCLEALGSDDRDIDRYVHGTLSHLPPAPNREFRRAAIDTASQVVAQRYENPARDALNDARRARAGLLVGVNTFFRDLHWRDSQSQPAGPVYLRERLSVLRKGDVVITTNYDCLIERVLLADSRWSPSDGYGFAVPLSTIQSADAQFRGGGDPNPLPLVVQKPSEVQILKLHGSVGWTTNPSPFGPAVLGDELYEYPQLYVSQDLFRGLASAEGPLTTLVFDTREPALGQPGDPAIVLPTYLKRTEGHEFHAIWLQVSQALAQADTVDIIGSSLPESDIGIRVLMNPLRARLASGSVTVRVQDPSPEAAHRWKLLLGRLVQWDPHPLSA